MLDSYHAWIRRRTYALPDDEERQLKRRLARSRGATAAHRQTSDNSDVMGTSAYALSNMYLPPGSLMSLPLALRASILDFVSVVDDMYANDIEELTSVVALDDMSILNNVATRAMLLELGNTAGGASPRDGPLGDECRSTAHDGAFEGHSHLPSPQRRASHPIVSILGSIERELQVTYEGRIVGELQSYAALLGIAVAPDGLAPDGQQQPRGSGGGVQRGVSFRRSSVAPSPGQHGGADNSVCATTPSHERSPSTALPPRRAPSIHQPLQHSPDKTLPSPQQQFSFYQRDWFLTKIRAARQIIRQQRHRFDRALSWVSFREKTLDATCVALRSTIREDLGAWEDILKQWRLPNSHAAPTVGAGRMVGLGAPPAAAPVSPNAVDVLFEMALGELKRYQARVSSVEFLGNPGLTLDDVRNLFWEVHRTRPSDAEVSSTYAQSLTLRQAMTLGLTEIPWVRGYSWEERVAPGDLDDAADDGASIQMGLKSAGGGGQSPAANTGSRSIASVARSERMQQLLGTYGVDDTMRRQFEELENERLQLEAHVEAQRRRAFAVAADGMSQRLWMSTQLYQPRTEHTFRGCEVCNATPIHMVGLRRENAAVCDDIVLCEACYQEMFGEEGSIAHRMYQWYVVRDLIGCNGAAPLVMDDGEDSARSGLAHPVS